MNENEFEGFVMPEARMLPVILLLDVSGSMSYDAKMDELNSSVREMLESFQKEQIVQAEICVSIITFGSEVKVHTELTPARDIQYTDMVANGMTYMGRALDKAYEMIEDKTKIPKNAYRPVVVLVSDGAPNGRISLISLRLLEEALSVIVGVLQLEQMQILVCLRSF